MRLVDTTVAIDHLRGLPSAVDLFRHLILNDEEIAASELVRFELLVGVKPIETQALERFFTTITWIPADEAVVRAAAVLARRYRSAFGGIDDVDYLIAATSILLDAPLLTTNVRHFPMLVGLEPAYIR